MLRDTLAREIVLAIEQAAGEIIDADEGTYEIVTVEEDGEGDLDVELQEPGEGDTPPRVFKIMIEETL